MTSKVRRAPVSTLALMLVLAGAGSAASPLAPLTQAQTEGGSGWRLVGLPGGDDSVPLSRFDAAQVDGVAGLRVATAASYGNWVSDWRGAAPVQLSWRWRLDQPLGGGRVPANILTKAGDDTALKVCVAFDHPMASVPLWERTTLRLARHLSGEALPAATVCYLWDSSLPAGTEGANAYSRRVRYVVLQGREAPLSRWVSESRDPVQDYLRLFADELPAQPAQPGAQASRHPVATAVLVGADSDNTGGRSEGWVADLRATAP